MKSSCNKIRVKARKIFNSIRKNFHFRSYSHSRKNCILNTTPRIFPNGKYFPIELYIIINIKIFLSYVTLSK